MMISSFCLGLPLIRFMESKNYVLLQASIDNQNYNVLNKVSLMHYLQGIKCSLTLKGECGYSHPVFLLSAGTSWTWIVEFGCDMDVTFP